MSYWTTKAMHKRQREKTASKATREALMEAYTKGRNAADDRQRKQNMDRQSQDTFSPAENLEGVPGTDGEVGGEPVPVVREKEDR